ncbi:MAG TPA: UDP-N-acetylmuramoyl-tripeptide--D-alanyl-D-alanine ligase [Candidatus Saccharimonadales bacterium]|nr:UDP-N-acetylmuramoyl-tripeptide--D-alanyl-D-alanine ligase [Candidatus Saccharimonadales bacterium]
MNIIRGLVYILQKESYDVRRFLAFVYSDWHWWSFEKRQQIDWTQKARAIYYFLLALVICLIALAVAWFKIWALIFLIAIVTALPLLTVLVLWLLWPLDYFLKIRVLKKAKQILAKINTPVIGITGSYGKTSLKEILAVVLESGFKIIKTPNNVNTDLGIAYFIISHQTEITAADFFIVEMGAYQIGDIANICNLVGPAYSFLTGINESHLERFGSLENTIKAKFELAERTAKKVILNFTDKKVKDNYQRFKLANFQGIDYSAVSEIEILSNFSGLSFKYDELTFSTRLLAKHNIILMAMALNLAKELGLDLNKAQAAIAAMPIIKNRLEPIWNAASRLMVLDDSYNGNFDGFVSGLEVLERADGRRLVITPGLVELGNKKEERHREIARLYASKKIDLVLLIKNSATAYIADEFQKIGFVNYQEYPDTISAHQDLTNILHAGDTIIFQNDWPDNYK